MLRILVLLVFSLGFAAAAFAGDCPEPDLSKMLEVQTKMMEQSGPGPEHELLAKLAGEWDGQMTVWPMAGMEPMNAPVSGKWESVLGGRFLQGVQSGNFMGSTFESIGMMGYDRRHEVYTLTGYDDMGTYSVSSSGKYDAATRILKLSGTDDDPVAGITQVYDLEIEFVDDNTMLTRLIFHCPTYGAEGPHTMMESKLTRKKS